ncbi:hypothetical protein X739_14710 [Mesorhizobium sp. LNHC220B00]|nr:hypothetical protein X739_14710 [Mesorhizobium sp. LNHC220B00]
MHKNEARNEQQLQPGGFPMTVLKPCPDPVLFPGDVVAVFNFMDSSDRFRCELLKTYHSPSGDLRL